MSTTELQHQINSARDIFRENLPEEVSNNIEDGASFIQSLQLNKSALKQGDTAPDFTLENQHGESITLSEVAKQNDFTVVTFYRGSWCPYCNLHLLNYQKSYDKIKALGTEIIALTAELPEGETLAQTLALPDIEGLEIARPKIEFSIAHDPTNNVSRKFGLSFTTPDSHMKVLKAINVDLEKYNGNTSGEVADPATFLLDSDLNVVWAFVPSDYRVRADISEVVAAIEEYNAATAQLGA